MRGHSCRNMQLEHCKCMVVAVEQFLWTGLLVDGSRLVTNASSNVDFPKFVTVHVADTRVQRPSYN